MEAVPFHSAAVRYNQWVSHQFHDPPPFPEYFGIKIDFHHHKFVDASSNFCVFHKESYFLEKQEVMLNEKEAFNHLSSHLSTMEIPEVVHPEMIKEIIYDYTHTSRNQTKKSEKDLPIIVFQIIINTWMPSYNGEEVGLMEADTCKDIPAAKCAIDALEEVTFNDFTTYETCMVCLEDIRPGQKITQMPCLHKFHGDCIIQWLERRHQCPICRFHLLTQLGQYCPNHVHED